MECDLPETSSFFTKALFCLGGYSMSWSRAGGPCLTSLSGRVYLSPAILGLFIDSWSRLGCLPTVLSGKVEAVSVLQCRSCCGAYSWNNTGSAGSLWHVETRQQDKSHVCRKAEFGGCGLVWFAVRADYAEVMVLFSDSGTLAHAVSSCVGHRGRRLGRTKRTGGSFWWMDAEVARRCPFIWSSVDVRKVSAYSYWLITHADTYMLI